MFYTSRPLMVEERRQGISLLASRNELLVAVADLDRGVVWEARTWARGTHGDGEATESARELREQQGIRRYALAMASNGGHAVAEGESTAWARQGGQARASEGSTAEAAGRAVAVASGAAAVARAVGPQDARTGLLWAAAMATASGEHSLAVACNTDGAVLAMAQAKGDRAQSHSTAVGAGALAASLARSASSSDAEAMDGAHVHAQAVGGDVLVRAYGSGTEVNAEYSGVRALCGFFTDRRPHTWDATEGCGWTLAPARRGSLMSLKQAV